MGTSHSKCFVSDPDRFARRITPEQTGGPQAQYDYIIVGGGEPTSCASSLKTLIEMHQERPDVSLRLAYPKIQTSPSCLLRQVEGMQLCDLQACLIQR